MADESRTGNLPLQKAKNGEAEQNSMTDDEIVQLSDLISDCMASTTLEDDQDTGSFATPTDEDTGEFKPVKD